MDTTTTPSWSEGIKPMEEKKTTVNQPQALNCPRCNSSQTKFCYYNNYNLSQPRCFCKTCRRYWTAGGTLRNVPVGGGSRKINKRSSSSSSKVHHLDQMMIMPQLPATSSSNMVSQNPNQHIIPNTTNIGDQDDHLVGFFKSGNLDSARGMMMMNNSFMPSNTMMMKMKMNPPNGFENVDQDKDRAVTTTTTIPSSTSARLFFPLEDLKPTTNLASTTRDQNEDSNCNVYWSGGGSW